MDSMIAKPLMFYFVLLFFFVPAALGADGRYSIHTSGLNSSVYVNMLYFANLVNQIRNGFHFGDITFGRWTDQYDFR
jgi:hypothetical protein